MLGVFDFMQYMLLGDVGDFVGQYCCYFVFVFGGQYQFGIDFDVVVQCGKGIDLVVFEYEECVGLLWLGVVGIQLCIYCLQLVVYQWVIEQIVIVVQFVQYYFVVFGLVCWGQQFVG